MPTAAGATVTRLSRAVVRLSRAVVARIAAVTAPGLRVRAAVATVIGWRRPAGAVSPAGRGCRTTVERSLRLAARNDRPYGARSLQDRPRRRCAEREGHKRLRREQMRGLQSHAGIDGNRDKLSQERASPITGTRDPDRERPDERPGRVNVLHDQAAQDIRRREGRQTRPAGRSRQRYCSRSCKCACDERRSRHGQILRPNLPVTIPRTGHSRPGRRACAPPVRSATSNSAAVRVAGGAGAQPTRPPRVTFPHTGAAERRLVCA